MKFRPNARPRPSSGGRKAGPADFDDEALLDLRFCDLDLRWKEPSRVAYRAACTASWKPARSRSSRTAGCRKNGSRPTACPASPCRSTWLIGGWRLEDRMMLDVEGGTAESCLRILRHEAGHALDTAFRLHRRSDWRRVFGKASKPYPDYYQPRTHSRRYVLHLNSWYAQSHPSEDFAETFAVWLSPDSDWRRDYADWPARRKLEYVDSLMGEIAGQKASVRARRHVEPLSEIRKTLRAHYEEKHARFIAGQAQVYDRGLRRLFSPAPGRATQETAADFLRRTRPELRRVVADMTGELEYTIDQVLQEMIMRCRHLRLYRQHGQRRTEEEAASLLAHANQELFGKRSTPVRLMRPRRLLVLMHEALVPPASIKGVPAKEVAEWKTEYDVVAGLSNLGHDVRPLGVSNDLGVLRDAIVDWKPDIHFNLLEEFHGVTIYDQHVVSYLELMQQCYTGCNPRGLMLAHDKALSKKILSYHRISVPDFTVYPLGRVVKRAQRLKFPLLVKSATEEASLGISQASIVTSDEKLKDRVAFVHEQFAPTPWWKNTSKGASCTWA